MYAEQQIGVLLATLPGMSMVFKDRHVRHVAQCENNVAEYASCISADNVLFEQIKQRHLELVCVNGHYLPEQT